ncbi:hypothetical protein F5Y06DRAFT_297390 [Hypoxylon sp. FL0890]|nr:hypothetical protein F5Y06DRAFT_297390 [Hypoxylon sp. FL0890]
MERDSLQTSDSDQQVTTVTTNNFPKVLEHFDKKGHLINPKTRFDIQCSICYEKNLALVNPTFDKRSRDTHESYAVLPLCGHAFGYTCLLSWLMQDRIYNSRCPVCRKQVTRVVGKPVIFSIFGDSGADEQHQEVLDIKKSLKIDKVPAGFAELLERYTAHLEDLVEIRRRMSYLFRAAAMEGIQAELATEPSGAARTERIDELNEYITELLSQMFSD